MQSTTLNASETWIRSLTVCTTMKMRYARAFRLSSRIYYFVASWTTDSTSSRYANILRQNLFLSFARLVGSLVWSVIHEIWITIIIIYENDQILRTTAILARPLWKRRGTYIASTGETADFHRLNGQVCHSGRTAATERVRLMQWNEEKKKTFWIIFAWTGRSSAKFSRISFFPFIWIYV